MTNTIDAAAPETQDQSDLEPDAKQKIEKSSYLNRVKTSALSSIAFTLAGATFIGGLGALTGRLMDNAKTKGPKNEVMVFAGMMSFGLGCMIFSNFMKVREETLQDRYLAWRMRHQGDDFVKENWQTRVQKEPQEEGQEHAR